MVGVWLLQTTHSSQRNTLWLLLLICIYTSGCQKNTPPINAKAQQIILPNDSTASVDTPTAVAGQSILVVGQNFASAPTQNIITAHPTGNVTQEDIYLPVLKVSPRRDILLVRLPYEMPADEYTILVQVEGFIISPLLRDKSRLRLHVIR